MRSTPREVAPGVHRLGRDRHNFYLVVEGGRATVVDAGGSAELSLLQTALAGLGMALGDVEAVLLTHAHTDHVGFAALASRQGIPVKAHEDEAAYARDRSAGSQMSVTDLPLWRPAVWVFLAEMIRAGAHKGYPVPGVETVADDETLDLPGRPRVVHTPGHTAGHAAYVLEERGILFAGDAIATRSPIRAGVGPRMLEDLFHADPAEARSSLRRLAGLETTLLLPGHGDPWSGPIAALVSQALA
ncbi:MAG: MBL fold metallo-hydrolase [Actinobacteria bacterium]|nr:MBL fold metallo-hydrolase [Actinomycetota bacterium]